MSDQGSDEEGFCICDPNVKLPRISYFTRRNCFIPIVPDAPDASDGWIRIGKVKQLFIYPVEYGTGYQQKRVICTANGPEFITFNDYLKEIKDRRLLVHTRDNPHTIDSTIKNVHLSPSTNLTNCEKEQFYYGPEREFDTKIDGERVFNRSYDDMKDIQLVRRPGGDEDESSLQKLITHTNPDLRLGYFTAERRNQLIRELRFTKENRHIRGMLPNYSHFTLINTKSVEYLKQRFEIHMKKYRNLFPGDPRDISYKNFFPHIVMEGDPCSQFQEDAVKRVRIGKVEFGDILPCLQEECLIYNHVTPTQRFDRLRIYLGSHRPVHKIFNELDDESEMPVFGINMEKMDMGLEKEDDNIISENDIVYVKY